MDTSGMTNEEIRALREQRYIEAFGNNVYDVIEFVTRNGFKAYWLKKDEIRADLPYHS